MKLRHPQNSALSNACRRGVRFAAAFALSMVLPGQSLASALTAKDFVALVEACVDQTSLNLRKANNLSRAVESFKIQPLALGSEEDFALHALLKSMESTYPNFSELAGINDEEMLEKFTSNSGLQKRWIQSVVELNQREHSAGSHYMGLNPYPVVDEDNRQRTYWWLDSSKQITAEFSPLILPGTSLLPICRFTNFPDAWAKVLLESPQFSFGVETKGKTTRNLAIVDTLPSYLGYLYFLATRREKANGMLNAKVQMTRYPISSTTEISSGVWILTVTSNYPPRG